MKIFGLFFTLLCCAATGFSAEKTTPNIFDLFSKKTAGVSQDYLTNHLWDTYIHEQEARTRFYSLMTKPFKFTNRSKTMTSLVDELAKLAERYSRRKVKLWLEVGSSGPYQSIEAYPNLGDAADQDGSEPYVVLVKLPGEIFEDGTAKFEIDGEIVDFIDAVRRQILLADALAFGLSGAQSSRQFMISDSFITNSTRQDFESVLAKFRGMRGNLMDWDIASFVGIRCDDGESPGSWARINSESIKSGSDVTIQVAEIVVWLDFSMKNPNRKILDRTVIFDDLETLLLGTSNDLYEFSTQRHKVKTTNYNYHNWER